MTPPERGDVFWVPFIYHGRTHEAPPVIKRRPCVVLSSSWYHSGRGEVILAAMTSNTKRVSLPGDTLIRRWQEAGLRSPTVATMILRTVPADTLGGQLGTLASEDMDSITENLQAALGV
ncbi:MAG: type II toxin-antitoxin system PemK/MazF family toxin [Thermoplasmata archaeon]